MTRQPIPTWFFSLVVVRKEDEFLLVQEAKRGNPWFLPAGRVEPGETLLETARREAKEEGGLPIELEGILRIDHTPHPSGTARVRVYFLASPTSNQPPKSSPDEESLQARWFTLSQLDDLNLRGREVPLLLHSVMKGAPVYSLDLLKQEGESFDLTDNEEVE